MNRTYSLFNVDDFASAQGLRTQPQTPTLHAATPSSSDVVRPQPKRKGGQEAVRWCFTVNNPGIWRPKYYGEAMDYLVWQLEEGESGTPHVQGYVRFKTKKRLGAVKAFLCQSAHAEVARGSEKKNKEYCTKPEGRIEIGDEHGVFKETAGIQGARNDLAKVVDEIKEGLPLQKIASENPTTFVKYHAGIIKLRQVIQPKPPPMREVKILVLWGSTGVGKSYRINSMFPDAFKVNPGRSPWDTYDNEEVVFFDEFDPKSWPVTEMNQYLDIYRLELNCRYANKYARWSTVVICSNMNPIEWYNTGTEAASPEQVKAIRRRLGSSCRFVTSIQGNPLESEPNPNFCQ